ncbi:uncharacterized protein L201_004721 [Kwoniella dendrophila CBS 6074]|uniref:BTB domain-containing protein n=1 Tax=Kwoniella dendrophila CBS 6074 TaxID=1295534 RepID=A0AAX4JYY8_9TREE
MREVIMKTTTTTTTIKPPSQFRHHRRPSQEVISKLSTISEEIITPLNKPFQQDKTCDLVLISADGLGFKVHSSKLMDCSNKFQDILKTPLSPSPSPIIKQHPFPLLTPPSSPLALSPLSSISSPILLSRSKTYPTFSSSTTTASSHLQDDFREIQFADPSMEGSITISLFLHLLYNLVLPIPTLSVYFKAYENLVLFLKKWDCSHALLDRLSENLKEWLEDGYISSSKGFRIGDLMRNDQLLVESIKRTGEYTWSGKSILNPNPNSSQGSNRGRSSTRTGDGIDNDRPQQPKMEIQFDILRDGLPGEPSLDLTAVPYEYFVELSDEVKFALLRAGRMGTEKKGEINWDKVGEEFQKVLRELRCAK